MTSILKTTPALHAGSAVRANPLHTEYTIHSTLAKLHYKKIKQSKTNPKMKQYPSHKHAYLPTPPPIKTKRNTHTYTHQSDYYFFFTLLYKGRKSCEASRDVRDGINRGIAW